MFDFLKSRQDIVRPPDHLDLEDGRRISVIIRENPRAKRLIMRFDPKNWAITVTTPHLKYGEEVAQFLDSRKVWIQAQVDKSIKPQLICPDMTILYKGEEVVLHHNSKRRSGGHLDANGLWIAGPLEHFDRRCRDFLKKQARDELGQAVNKYAEMLSVERGRITIRDTKTRWGSCSHKGDLNFSWRLIMAPDFVLDYVAAHEVAHIIEHNHSAAFWGILDKTCPEYKSAKKWLNRHGSRLHQI